MLANRPTLGLTILCSLVCYVPAAWADPMTVLSVRVNQSTDDAEQRSDGTVNLYENVINADMRPWVGLRFRNLTIPAGATITKAYVSLKCAGGNTNVSTLTFYAEDADSPTTFASTFNNISNRTRTTNSVTWNVPSWVDNVVYSSPDLTDVIQEVVDRPGWASGNSLNIILGSSTTGERKCDSYDGSSINCPSLYIEYTPFSRPVAPNLLFVCTSTSAPTTEELKREEWIKWWAYKVTRIAATDTTTNFNTAAAANDVAYIPETITSTDLNTKLLSRPIGVVTDEPNLTDDFQVATLAGATGANGFVVNSNTHYITSPFSTGSRPLFTTGAISLEVAGTLGKEVVCLGAFTNSARGLVTLEAGGLLADSSKAAGRRVFLPWAASTAFTNLNSDGLSIFKRSLEWAAGLEAWWKLDESAGTTAVDSSRNAYNGDVTGTASWSPTGGKVSGAINLNGTTYVQAAATSSSLPKNLTLSGWANCTAAGTSGAELISVGDYAAIRLGTTFTKVFFYNGSTWPETSITTNYIGAGWHHFAMVFDDDNNALKLFVDGSLAATYSTTNSISWGGLGSYIRIGKHGNTQTTMNFTGLIDDVRIYNYALSADEVLNLKRVNQPRSVRVLKWVETQ